MDEVGSDEDAPGILESLWRYKWSSLAIVVVMVALSVAAGLFVAPGTQATAVIALATPAARNPLAPGIQGDAALARYTAQRAGFVESDAVLSSVAQSLGREDLTAIRREVSASPSATSNSISITAEAKTAAEAVALADAVVVAYRTETAEEVSRLTDLAVASIEETSQQIENGPALLSGSPAASSAAASTLSELQLQATDLRTTALQFGDGVESVIAPRVDAVAIPGIPIREAAVGFILGLVIAATVAWLRADQNRMSSIRSRAAREQKAAGPIQWPRGASG